MMTTVTTIGAIVMTPVLCKLLLGTLVPVDAVGVAVSTVQVVLIPIVLGMGFNYKFPQAVKKIEPFSPIVGVLSTILLVGSAVAQVRTQL
jgi:BASS family bile acid:Na+ symporter